MIKRYLYVADPHIDSNQPTNRLDNIVQVNEDKFRRLAHIYKEMKCDATWCAGDLFQNYKPDIESIRIVLDYIENTGEFWLLPGNHDLPPGGNPTHFGRTLFSLVAQLTDNIRIFNNKIRMNNVEIRPIQFTRRFGDMFIIPSDADLVILITHLLIDADGKYTDITDITTSADLFLCSHTHFPFDKTINGSRFYNPGCLIRRRAPEKTITPRVGIIEIDTIAATYDLKTIKLGSPRAQFRVKPKKIDTENYDFSELIADMQTVSDTMDMNSVMQQAYELTKTTDKEVINYVEKMLSEVKQ